MTHNIFVKCDVCGSIIDFKWQVGYLPKSVFRANCGRCKTLIEGILYISEDSKISYEIKNAEEIISKSDVNCDYVIPISGEILTEKMKKSQEMYTPGPFINIVGLVGIEKFVKFNQRYLNGISKIKSLKDICDRLDNLYTNKEYKYMIKLLNDDFKIKIKKNNETKIIESKYNIDFSYYKSFVDEKKYLLLKEKIFSKYKEIKHSNRNEYKRMLMNLKNEIDKSEKKLREILNLFVEKYNCFIPVLLLEYVDSSIYDEVCKNYAITTVDFDDIRNMYLRIYEVVIFASSIIVGLNDIIYRGDYEIINDSINNKNRIEDYWKMSKGNKLKYLALDEVFNIIIPKFEKDIRNAIGHEDIEYDVFNQELKYDGGKMYLIEYVFNIWDCYVNCFLLYELILDIKLDMLQMNILN